MRSDFSFLILAALAAIVLHGCGDDSRRGADTGAADTGLDGTAGDGGGDGAVDATTDAPSDAARICTAEQDAVAAFIASNKTCSEASDCVQVAAGCYEAQEDCCVVYMADGYDETMWASLTTDLETCASKAGACGCCAAIPAAPGCNAGSCGPATP